MKPLAALGSTSLALIVLAAPPQASPASSPRPSVSVGTADPRGVPQRADLVIGAIERHDATHVRITVRNRGASAVMSWMRVKLSSAELGARFVFQQVQPMPPGSVQSFTFAVEEGVCLGEIDQVIEGSADYFRHVNESDELNNTRRVSSLSLF